MAFLGRSHLLKTRINYSHFCRIMLRIRDQHYVRNFHSRSNALLPISRPQNLFSDQMLGSSMWNFRSYAKRMGGKAKGSKHVAVLTDDEMMDVVDVFAYRESLQAVVNKLKADFIAHLSVRTSAGNIESLRVTIDGEAYPLNELAQISRKHSQLIAINLAGFPEGLKPVLQAITESGLGINPQQEGTMIYLPLPKVTRELRETLAKNAKTLFTKTKDEIRNIQNSFIRQAKNQTQLPKDLIFSTVLQLTAIAENYTNEGEKILRAKQNDLLENV